MPSPRWLAGLTVPEMMVGAALVTNAAIATADPVNDAYLNQLRAVGITWPPGHEEALIGRRTSFATISGGVGRHSRLPTKSMPTWTQTGATLLDVGSMVNLAHSTYCPNQRCWAPPLLSRPAPFDYG